ncbi:DDE_3 domain-containing protein [Trichonephila clavipes]|nr:DDE_3 domain-containing protein [Trichonephila clavipes]
MFGDHLHKCINRDCLFPTVKHGNGSVSKGKVTKEKHKEVLADQVYPMMQMLSPARDGLFEDVNTLIHAVGLVQSWFDEHEDETVTNNSSVFQLSSKSLVLVMKVIFVYILILAMMTVACQSASSSMACSTSPDGKMKCIESHNPNGGFAVSGSRSGKFPLIIFPRIVSHIGG